MAIDREKLSDTIRYSSLATLIGLACNYSLHYGLHVPLWTDRMAETIMAWTPSRYAVPILHFLGAWAKPWAATGALAALGSAIFLARFIASFVSKRLRTFLIAVTGVVLASALVYIVHYESLPGALSFWGPALIGAILLHGPAVLRSQVERRGFLAKAATYGLPVVMGSGTVGVAVESYLRNRATARNAVRPVDLFPFSPALDRARFSSGLARKPVTPIPEFYGMSKDAVDPAVDPLTWRLTITLDGRSMRSYSYAELLSLPRQRRYQTLRCISNTLQSDLMGTAQWAGVNLSQLVDRRVLPPQVIEAAFIGVEGHDDSLSIDYAFSEQSLLALGMNGKTLSRTHGFPVRLLAPRYYGCRNVKWLREIRFVTRPYYGTWQRMGYTKEPVIHIASHVDHVQRDGRLIRFGGVSFAGDRSISAVRIRVNRGSWSPATLEPPLSQYTWTRWWAATPAQPGDLLEVNAQDEAGKWQELAESDPFPTGLAGPTVVKVNV